MTISDMLHRLRGLYLQLAGGEEARWLPVADGPHQRFASLVFASGKIQFVDATSGESQEVSLEEEFGELLIRTGAGGVARLVKTGRFTAQLVYPNGSTVERLKGSRYQGRIYRHALTFFAGGELGGASVRLLPDGALGVGDGKLSLADGETWTHRLPDGSTLQRDSAGLITRKTLVSSQHYWWDSVTCRLLECDFHRQQLHFSWATSAANATASLLDGIVTVNAEDGSVQLWYGATKLRGEEIDFVGPGGIHISRAAGSDRLWIFQNGEVVGVADFVANAGMDDRGRMFHRWAYAAGGYAALPHGQPQTSPIATLVVVLLAAAVPLAFLDESAAMLIAMPLAALGVGLFAIRGLKRLAGEVWA